MDNFTGSFTDCSRLYALQGALAQQEWRIPTLMKKILIDLKPFLTHSYMSVRDRLGSMLTNIFLSDLTFEGQGGNERNPKMADFINEILPTLECLAHEATTSDEKETNNTDNGNVMPMDPMGVPPPMGMMPLIAPNGPGGANGAPRMPIGDLMAKIRGALPPEMAGKMPPPEVLMRMMGPRPPMGPPPGPMGPPPGPMGPMMMMGPGGPMGPPPPMGVMPPPMGFGPPPPEFMGGPLGALVMPPNGANGDASNGDPVKEERQKAVRLLQSGKQTADM